MTEILYQNFSDQAIVVRKGEALEKNAHKQKYKKNDLPPIILLLIFQNHFVPNQSPEKQHMIQQ